MKAPFPWFGGKSKAAALIWSRFGSDVGNYVEPFLGSAAVFLSRPKQFTGWATLNDFDGHVVNFWRSVERHPEETAQAACQPVFECCPSGTKITTAEGEIPIEEIKIGTIVMGWKSGKIVKTKVIGITQSKADFFYKIRTLMVTGNHPVFTQKGYVNACTVLESDSILRLYEKKNVANLHTFRPKDVGGSLRRSDVQGKAQADRTHEQGEEGAKNTPLRLDEIANEKSNGACLHHSGTIGKSGRLARKRKTLDFKFSKESALQPYSRRGGGSRLCSDTRTKSNLEQAKEGCMLPQGAPGCYARKNTQPGNKSKDQRGRPTKEVDGTTEGDVKSFCKKKGNNSRKQVENGYRLLCRQEDKGVSRKGKGLALHSPNNLRTDGESFPLYQTCSNGDWCHKRKYSSRFERAKKVQRIQLQNSVTVFNFETATGNYFAEGILVHNCDLHARHLALVNRRVTLTERLCADPDYCEPRLAGWWAWGACCWIGGGWCAGDGPWQAEPDADGVPVFAINGGKGVNRQLPHLGNGGTGVNRKLPHLGDGGTGVNRKLDNITAWFRELQDSLMEARIACGDWQRICFPGSMTRNGPCAVLLDPPYSQTAAVYATDSSTVAHDVREWCKINGTNPLLRIALCGHAGEHEELEALGWTVETWGKGGGYQGADDRERIWFSPACKTASAPNLFSHLK